MSQHDYDIANQAGSAFRSDLNTALAAIVSQNSGATAPATPFAYQWWADTTTGILKQRNAANSAWISILTLATGGPLGTIANQSITAANSNTVEATSGPGASSFSFRNKLINGAFGIDQRNSGAAQTITASAALAYTADRWYGYCTGANVTGQRVAGTAPNQYNYRYTGAASVTKIGHAQRIEAANCQDLAGKTATLSVDLANSVLTTVTWTAWYANTANTFGTLASPTRTSIGTGTFTVNSTLTRYNASISIPSGATTGIEVELSVGAQTSGTWTIGRVQFEEGGITPFAYIPTGLELVMCQWYYSTLAGYTIAGGGYGLAGNVFSWNFSLPISMRATPTLSGGGFSNVNLSAQTLSALGTNHVGVANTVNATGAYTFTTTTAVTASAEL
jgi:hypothetical protein